MNVHEASEEVLEACRASLNQGGSVNDVLQLLFDSGLSKVGSIWSLKRLGVASDISESKELVHLSPVWAFRRKQDDEFHDRLEELIEQVLKEDAEQ